MNWEYRSRIVDGMGLWMIDIGIRITVEKLELRMMDWN